MVCCIATSDNVPRHWPTLPPFPLVVVILMSIGQFARVSVRFAALAFAIPLAPGNAQSGVGMFRGDAAHTGRYAGGGSVIAGLQWRVPTDGDVTSSPVVVGDVVCVGTGDGHVLALDRTTGRTRWSYDAGSPVQSSPAVAGGLVFVASRDGALHGVDAATGKRRWRVATGALRPLPWGHESGDRYLSSPTYAGGMLVAGSGDGNVYALDPATGAIRWRAATGGRIRGTPAVAGGRVFVGSYDGRVYAFDLATGKQRWRFDTDGVSLNSADFGYDRRSIQSSPAVANGVVFVGARDGLLYAIDADAGTLRWRYDHKISWVIGSPAIADGVVYVGSSDAHFMQALDATTGVEKWRTGAGSIVWSSPAVAGAYVYYGDGAGRLHVGDRGTGKDLAVFRTGATIHSSPVIDGSLAFFGSDDGGVYAVRLADGPPVKRAVFFDSTYLSISQIQNAAEVSRYLGNRGYETLDARSLASFLEARISDRAPSVVVFAIDALPDAVASEPVRSSLFRRYLDSGGKVVWSGLPPMIWPVQPGKERAGLKEVMGNAPSELLGVGHDDALFDVRAARVTDEGKRWGVPARTRTAWGVLPSAVSQVLSVDDWGLASSWVKNYGGPEGTGFVRVPADDLLGLYLAAEYRPTATRK
jgi:eukaryotic-like serine/threonine-protein kinase